MMNDKDIFMSTWAASYLHDCIMKKRMGHKLNERETVSAFLFTVGLLEQLQKLPPALAFKIIGKFLKHCATCPLPTNGSPFLHIPSGK